MRRKAILNVDHMRIERSGTVILDDVSWRVEPGQHWVILGANGSGKTSLLSALTGYLMPTKGDIELLGERFGESDWRALRMRIGLVSSSIRQMMADTETALETVVSGKYAMIDYWGAIKKADRAAGLRLLKQVECSYLEERPWAYLSQGERQRILIGRGLMARPKLLILDEPCAGLDPAARENFLLFLERLGKQRGAPALVLVTHHVEEIMPVFTHVLALREGKVVASGPKQDVLNSKLLSTVFGAQIQLRNTAGRYSLTVKATKRVII